MIYDYAYIEWPQGFNPEPIFAEVNKMGEDGWRLKMIVDNGQDQRGVPLRLLVMEKVSGGVDEDW